MEKEHADWLRALTPARINALAEYWPQKVLAVSSANAATQNYVSIYEQQTRPNLGFQYGFRVQTAVQRFSDLGILASRD